MSKTNALAHRLSHATKLLHELTRDVRFARRRAQIRKLAGVPSRVWRRELAGVRIALDPAARHGWDEFESLYHDVESLGEIANAW